MLRAYRLVYPCSPHAPPQLWEWQQPHVDYLVLNARTFRRRVVGWWCADWDALDHENRRIWATYYRPKVRIRAHRGLAGTASGASPGDRGGAGNRGGDGVAWTGESVKRGRQGTGG